MEDMESPDVIKSIAAAVQDLITPTIELEIRDGKLFVLRKDYGFRLIIHDYDQENEIDTYHEWEKI